MLSMGGGEYGRSGGGGGGGGYGGGGGSGGGGYAGASSQIPIVVIPSQAGGNVHMSGGFGGGFGGDFAPSRLYGLRGIGSSDNYGASASQAYAIEIKPVGGSGGGGGAEYGDSADDYSRNGYDQYPSESNQLPIVNPAHRQRVGETDDTTVPASSNQNEQDYANAQMSQNQLLIGPPYYHETQSPPKFTSHNQAEEPLEAGDNKRKRKRRK